MNLKTKEIEVDIRFNVGRATMYTVHHMNDPLWFTERLSDIKDVDGVGVHTDGISVHLSGTYDDVMEAIEQSKQIITEILT